jgi:hypothetical protein
MSSETFVVSLAAVYLGFAVWAFRQLPQEGWQILASVPIMKDMSGRWHGLNFTYYGLLTANALLLACALLIVLFGSLKVPTGVTLTLVLVLLMVCLPAAKWVARIVEGKNYTFTVAGAFFVGIFIAPLTLRIFNMMLHQANLYEVPILPALAAFTIVSGFGEGLGRVACISFGCCYGKPLSQVHPLLQRVFNNWNFVFSGKMKKIAYASGMDGTQVVPVQALTSTLYVAVSLFSTLLFLKRYYVLAFVLTMVVTQGWRIVSEVLRADHRGWGKISAYQVMGILAITYSIALAASLDSGKYVTTNLPSGINAFWQPEVVIFLQGLWVVVFVFFGKSMVTGAEISFHLYEDRI